MTIIEAIMAADDMRPNQLLPGAKIRWLSELDGKIALEVLLQDITEAQQYKYSEEQPQTELLVSFPHDCIYPMYLLAMIDMANGEFNRYQVDRELFNAAYGDMVKWFARVYSPAQTKRECRGECRR